MMRCHPARERSHAARFGKAARTLCTLKAAYRPIPPRSSPPDGRRGGTHLDYLNLVLHILQSHLDRQQFPQIEVCGSIEAAQIVAVFFPAEGFPQIEVCGSIEAPAGTCRSLSKRRVSAD